MDPLSPRLDTLVHGDKIVLSWRQARNPDYPIFVGVCVENHRDICPLRDYTDRNASECFALMANNDSKICLNRHEFVGAQGTGTNSLAGYGEPY